MIFVFKNDNDQYPNVAIEAPDVFAAMTIVKDQWYPQFFDFDFRVTIVSSWRLEKQE